MVGALVVCLVTCALIIVSVLVLPDIRIGKIRVGTYWIVALVGAATLLICDFLPIGEFLSCLATNNAVNPIKILVLFISMTIMSIFLDEIGFFRAVASYTLAHSGKSQKKLFLFLYLTVSLLTVFTSNDVIILTFTPFICYFAKNARINPLPFLTCEFVAANTWSMALIIGNPTNIYLASAYGISFLRYFCVMALPTVLCGFVSFAILFLLFRKSLTIPITGSNIIEKVQDKGLLIIGLIHLGLCTALLTISGYIGMEMWIITLCFAISLIVVSSVYCLIKKGKSHHQFKSLARAPWELIPFVLSMFVLVLSLSYNGVTEKLTSVLLASNEVFPYGISSFITANLVNNIPMSVFYTQIISGVPSSLVEEAVFASIAGSNLCALATPIGALAGIMWESLLQKNSIKYNFLSFAKNGLIVSLPALGVTLLALRLVLLFGI
ncbi:MAG: ArsB/NhaD family transporter [Clostridia bacterium]|nr:ArsB/NhaD family transporter [Clostridia bacterium]